MTNDHLQLIVNPTERCNLRCVYCYETFALGKMPQAIVSGIFNLVKRRAEKGLKTFRLEFFGGEPLVAWDVVESLARGLSDICRRQWDRDARRHDDQWRVAHARAPRSAGGLRCAFVPGHPRRTAGRSRSSQGHASGRGQFRCGLDVAGDAQGRAVSARSLDPNAFRSDEPRAISSAPLASSDGLRPRSSKDDERFRLHFHALGRWGGRQ